MRETGGHEKLTAGSRRSEGRRCMLSKATNAWRRLLRDESGQNMIEYALVAALIALGAIVAMQGVATSLSTAFSKVSSHLNASVT
jgi:pilus assembly protein Flp/PilA